MYLFQTDLCVKDLFICKNWNLFPIILDDILQQNLLKV